MSIDCTSFCTTPDLLAQLMLTYQLCTWSGGARGRGYVPSLGTYVYSYISITASLRISESSSTGTFCASVCASVRVGMIHPPCHTYIYIDKNTDQSLILLTTISCHLSAIQWITKMPINAFRQSRCLNTSESICDLFKSCVTGMTEMTKKMESRTWEELPEVYRLAVILVICVIGGSYLRVVDCLFYVGAVFKYNFGDYS